MDATHAVRDMPFSHWKVVTFEAGTIQSRQSRRCTLPHPPPSQCTYTRQQEYVTWAESGLKFLSDHCFDPADGRMFFHVQVQHRPHQTLNPFQKHVFSAPNIQLIPCSARWSRHPQAPIRVRHALPSMFFCNSMRRYSESFACIAFAAHHKATGSASSKGEIFQNIQPQTPNIFNSRRRSQGARAVQVFSIRSSRPALL